MIVNFSEQEVCLFVTAMAKYVPYTVTAHKQFNLLTLYSRQCTRCVIQQNFLSILFFRTNFWRISRKINKSSSKNQAMLSRCLYSENQNDPFTRQNRKLKYLQINLQDGFTFGWYNVKPIVEHKWIKILKKKGKIVIVKWDSVMILLL